MAFSMIAIAFLSWVVWGHHMFQSGMHPLLGTAFMMSTMVIGVPSAIKTFNWLGTIWGGNIQLKTPMLFALGFVSMFVIGGLSGIYMASTPVDIFFNVTFFPMHILGIGGHMRRIYNPLQYDFLKDLQPINVLITIGAIGLGI